MTNFKRFSALILAMLMILTSIAYAAPLYEKYEYKETYEYKDEYIAYALQATVPKIFLNCSATLEYAPIQFDVDLVMSQFDEMYNEYYPQYSEEDIAEVLYEHVCDNLSNYLSYGHRKEVETEGSFTGSAVVISDDGYIATNSHVVTLDDSGREMLYLSALDSGVMEDIENLIVDIEKYNISLTEEQINEIYMLIMQDAIEQASIESEETQLVVCFPTSDGDTDFESAIAYEAEVVAEGTSEGIDGLTQDTAIIKIDAENLIALRLSESYPELNSKITSAGYPAASDEIFLQAESLESVLSITVGTGQVSRLVPIEGQDYQAIGITTDISGGNSGGPSVDSSLYVEGLNTYGNAADVRYGFMVSAEYVRELSDKFDIEQGEASKTYLLGLQLLQDNYGKAALECFEAVKTMNPDTPYIETMISVAKKTPQEVPAEKSSGINWWLILIIAGGVILAAAIAVTILLIVKSSKKKKKATISSGSGYVGINTERSSDSYSPAGYDEPTPPNATYYDISTSTSSSPYNSSSYDSSSSSSPYGSSPYDVSYDSTPDYGTSASTLEDSSGITYYTPDAPTYKNPSDGHASYGTSSSAPYGTPSAPYGTPSAPYGTSASSPYGASSVPYNPPASNPYGAPHTSGYGASPAAPAPDTPVLRTTMSSHPSKPRSAPDPAFKKPTMSSGFRPAAPSQPQNFATKPYEDDSKTTRM